MSTADKYSYENLISTLNFRTTASYIKIRTGTYSVISNTGTESVHSYYINAISFPVLTFKTKL